MNCFIDPAFCYGKNLYSVNVMYANTYRRGKLIGEKDQSVTWVSGDASQATTVQAVINDFGPFDGCVHAVGLLLDVDSGNLPANSL